MDRDKKDSKVLHHLMEAREHFACWRLLDAYTIFRRFFDRIPFRPEKGHAEFIGMFVRTLCELGKENELSFYQNELERHYRLLETSWMGFTLGVVYYHSTEPRMEMARQLFEKVLADPLAVEFHAKAKMFLANYYDRVKNDVATCRTLIDSISDVSDPALKPLVEIWKAKILRDEKSYPEAEKTYLAVLQGLDSKKDWYPYFCAKVGLAHLYLATLDRDRACDVIHEVKTLFEGRHFKSIQVQLRSLEAKLGAKDTLGILKLHSDEKSSVVSYEKRTTTLKGNSPAQKLLLLLAKDKFLEKPEIVKQLYGRQYAPNEDDKLIYYHIHVLRKRLRAIGVPNHAIESRANGYELVPEVETLPQSQKAVTILSGVVPMTTRGKDVIVKVEA